MLSRRCRVSSNESAQTAREDNKTPHLSHRGEISMQSRGTCFARPGLSHSRELRAVKSTTSSVRIVIAILLMLWSAGSVHGQPPAVSERSNPEDIEPRTIGAAGDMLIGVSGYADRFFSTERELPAHVTLQVDVGRFLTRRILLQGGVAGSGSFGAVPDDAPTGLAAPALQVFGGGLFYFTPQSMMSLYSGAEYWVAVRGRESGDAGSVVGKVGAQGAVSSRASLFIEGGYGLGLTRGDAGRVARLQARLGVRLKW